jgi:hypothetical protein
MLTAGSFRSRRLHSTVLLLILVLVGCGPSVSEVMQSWEGSHYRQLYASWGPPQEIHDDGQGGRILIYTMTRSYTSPGYSTTNTQANVYSSPFGTGRGTATSSTTYVPPRTTSYQAYRMFYINEEGYIYYWAWRGL